MITLWTSASNVKVCVLCISINLFISLILYHQIMMSVLTIMVDVIRHATTLLVAFSAVVEMDTVWMVI